MEQLNWGMHPENSSGENENDNYELDDAAVESSPEYYAYKAKKLGLPEDVDSETLGEAMDRDYRVKRALSLGLPETATFKEIDESLGGHGRQISEALVLGLDRYAGWDDIMEKSLEQYYRELDEVREIIRRNRGEVEAE